ncbi:MAG: hypothetical protein ACK4SO_05480 [Candidatus Kapaibacteriota bacterium]
MNALSKLTSVLISFTAIVAFVLVAQEKTFDEELAKSKFIEAKCNTCHAFSHLGIEAKNKSANNKAPDFCDYKIEHDKDFLVKYMKKQETINNKKHPVAFKGSDEDLDLILSLILLHGKHDEKHDNNEKE